MAIDLGHGADSGTGDRAVSAQRVRFLLPVFPVFTEEPDNGLSGLALPGRVASGREPGVDRVASCGCATTTKVCGTIRVSRHARCQPPKSCRVLRRPGLMPGSPGGCPEHQLGDSQLAGRSAAAVWVIFFGLIIAGMILNTLFLVREIRRNEQHDSFINAVTHELKTPIASIRLYLETLQRRDVTDKQRREFYELMLLDTDRLMGTVKQVLKAGEVGYKHVVRERVEVDFPELVSQSMELARTRHHLPPEALRFPRAAAEAAEKNAREKPIRVTGDPEELRTAVYNLFDNAVKYSGKTVDITVGIDTPMKKPWLCGFVIAAWASPRPI